MYRTILVLAMLSLAIVSCVVAPVDTGPVLKGPLSNDCVLDVDCSPPDPSDPANACLVGACVNGKCSSQYAPRGYSCAPGLCDGSGVCVDHLAVVCHVGDRIYVECNGTSGGSIEEQRLAALLRALGIHPNAYPNEHLVRYQDYDGSVGTCGASSTSLGYCAPGGSCSVLIAGTWQIGRCL